MLLLPSHHPIESLVESRVRWSARLIDYRHAGSIPSLDHLLPAFDHRRESQVLERFHGESSLLQDIQAANDIVEPADSAVALG